MYLEPIFGSEDIMSQMPEEGRKFGIVDGLWREIMVAVSFNLNCLIATEVPNMLNNLLQANNILEEIQRGLNKYLEMKRLFFPRYFSGDIAL